MSYSHEKPFKDREHIIWEIGYCGRAANYGTYIMMVTLALGIISDALETRLLLGATAWLLIAVVAAVMSLGPHLHMILAKHLLGMEVINKEQKQ